MLDELDRLSGHRAADAAFLGQLRLGGKSEIVIIADDDPAAKLVQHGVSEVALDGDRLATVRHRQ
jgi:hypothetical protein